MNVNEFLKNNSSELTNFSELTGNPSVNRSSKLVNDAIAKATLKKGSALTKDEFKSAISGYLTSADKRAFWGQNLHDKYTKWIGKNSEFFGKYADESAASDTSTSADEIKEAFGIYTAPDDTGFQTHLNQLNELTGEQERIQMAELQKAESDTTRALGLTQLQYEQDIGKRRMQALKSGMSSAQLAAQEQQNLMASQIGATQLASNYALQRFETIGNFAGMRQQNYMDVQMAKQQGQSGAMNAWAQKHAADKMAE